MPKRKSLGLMLRQAQRRHERKRQKESTSGDIGTFVRAKFDYVMRVFTDNGGRWSDIAAVLGDARPLRTRAGKPIAEAPEALKKAFHRERRSRERQLERERQILSLAAVPPGFKPAIVVHRRQLPDRAPAPSPSLDDEAGLVDPALTALKRKMEGRG